MSKYNFSAFTKVAEGKEKDVLVTKTEGSSAIKTNLPGEKHYGVYIDMCEKRRITPKKINLFTTKSLYAEIAIVKALPYKSSDSQQDMIINLLTEINTIVPNSYKPLSKESLANLNSAGASSLIERLVGERRNLNEIAPATEDQATKIAGWMFCPDIPWEEYGIELKIYVTKLEYWSTEYDVPEDLEIRPFKAVTVGQLKEQIKRKIKQKEANAMMNKYGSIFYAWSKTRMTDGQILHIRQLEERLCDISVPKQVEIAVDFEGNPIEIQYGNSRERVYPDGYISLPDHELKQMSKQQATKFVYQLELEVKDKELGKPGNFYGDSQQTFQEKVQVFCNQTGLGEARDAMEARTVEHRRLTDFVYALGANMGYVDEDLANRMNEFDGDLPDDIKQDVKSYMYQAIDYKDMKSMLSSVQKLRGFAEKVESLDNIVSIIEDELNGHFNTNAENILEEVI